MKCVGNQHMYQTGPSSFFIDQRGVYPICVEDRNSGSGHNSEKTITWSVDDGRPNIIFHHYPHGRKGIVGQNRAWWTGISGGATLAFCAGAACLGDDYNNWVDSHDDTITLDVYL